MKATYKDITFEGNLDEVVKAIERILFDEKTSRGWVKTNEDKCEVKEEDSGAKRFEEFVKQYREWQKEIPPYYKPDRWQIPQGPTCT